MKTKTFYGVEYKSGNDGQTYDIFTKLKQARLFCKNILKYGEEYKLLYIFKAEFNQQNVYRENNKWNYDDSMNTIVRYRKYFRSL